MANTSMEADRWVQSGEALLGDPSTASTASPPAAAPESLESGGQRLRAFAHRRRCLSFLKDLLVISGTQSLTLQSWKRPAGNGVSLRPNGASAMCSFTWLLLASCGDCTLLPTLPAVTGLPFFFPPRLSLFSASFSSS